MKKGKGYLSTEVGYKRESLSFNLNCKCHKPKVEREIKAQKLLIYITGFYTQRAF